MYKEYRYPEKEKGKAKLKQEKLQSEYGYYFPAYRIELKGEKYLSIVYPIGLQPNPHRKTSHQFL